MCSAFLSQLFSINFLVTAGAADRGVKTPRHDPEHGDEGFQVDWKLSLQ